MKPSSPFLTGSLTFRVLNYNTFVPAPKGRELAVVLKDEDTIVYEVRLEDKL